MMRIRIKDEKLNENEIVDEDGKIEDEDLNLDFSELMMNNDEWEDFKRDFGNVQKEGSSFNSNKLDQYFTHHDKYFKNKDSFDQRKAQVVIYNLLKSYGLNIESPDDIDASEPYKIEIGCDDIVEAVEVLEILKAKFVKAYYGDTLQKKPIEQSQVQIFITEYDKYNYDVIILNRIGDAEDEYYEYLNARSEAFPDEKENDLNEAINAINGKVSPMIKNLKSAVNFVKYNSKLKEKEARENPENEE